jgi:hypothetical protein
VLQAEITHCSTFAMVTGYEPGRVEVEPKCAQINVSASGQRLSRAVESHTRDLEGIRTTR